MRKSILYITPIILLGLTSCQAPQKELNNEDQLTTKPTEILEKLESNQNTLDLLNASISKGKDFTMLHLFHKRIESSLIKDNEGNIKEEDKTNVRFEGDYTSNLLRETSELDGLITKKTVVGVQESAYKAKSKQYLDIQEEDFVYVRESTQNGKDIMEKFSLNQSEFAMKSKPEMLVNSKKVLNDRYVANVNNATYAASGMVSDVVLRKPDCVVINKVSNQDKFYVDILINEKTYIENHYVFENGRIRGSRQIASQDVKVLNDVLTTSYDITNIYTENAYNFDLPRYNTYEKITAQTIMDDETGNYAFLQQLCLVK